MCIVSNWVNEAQDFIAVKKYDDLPNSLIPTVGVFHKKVIVYAFSKICSLHSEQTFSNMACMSAAAQHPLTAHIGTDCGDRRAPRGHLSICREAVAASTQRIQPEPMWSGVTIMTAYQPIINPILIL